LLQNEYRPRRIVFESEGSDETEVEQSELATLAEIGKDWGAKCSQRSPSPTLSSLGIGISPPTSSMVPNAGNIQDARLFQRNYKPKNAATLLRAVRASEAY
jgi:hypothetical protein